MQRDDFDGLLRAMDGLPVIVRLLDPPLHEFLPSRHEVAEELSRLRDRLADADDDDRDALKARMAERETVAARVAQLEEANPMLGTRGVRLGILMPELYRMQVRALFEAAAQCARDGLSPRPEVMIPLVAHAGEIDALLTPLQEVVAEIEQEHGAAIPHHFGTMIELPRAALTAHEIATRVEFFSFGTNDLTQTVFGISRDDAEAGFLNTYLETGVLESNPFVTIDAAGVGRLMALAVADGRAGRPELETGICGEHGGDPESIALCHGLGLDYVSCSPSRVPIARLAAAHAALAATDGPDE